MAEVTAVEQDVMRRLNAFRRAHDLPTLMPHPKLAEVAMIQSRTMRDRGYFDHRRFKARIGITWAFAAEIIAQSDLSTETAEKIVQGWKDSDHHRNTILHPDYKFAGVGRQADEKRAWWTVDFGG
jgi:uncharacterized protein YkwD